MGLGFLQLISCFMFKVYPYAYFLLFPNDRWTNRFLLKVANWSLSPPSRILLDIWESTATEIQKNGNKIKNLLQFKIEWKKERKKKPCSLTCFWFPDNGFPRHLHWNESVNFPHLHSWKLPWTHELMNNNMFCFNVHFSILSRSEEDELLGW